MGSYQIFFGSNNGTASVRTEGAATFFTRKDPNSNFDWEQQGDPLVMYDGQGGVYNVLKVAIDGNTALVLAQNFNALYYRVFFLERDNGVWRQVKVFSGIREESYDMLSIAVEGNTGKSFLIRIPNQHYFSTN